MNRTIVVFGAQNSVGALAARQYGNQGYDVVLVANHAHCVQAVSYTHLTLPTNREV